MIYQEEAFNGKPAKIARSHGRNFRSRSRRKPLGYCRVSETQVIEPDANKACKKLPNIKCIVEVLLKWLEGMKKNLFKAKSQVGIIFEAKKEDILDKDEDEGNDGYYMDVELHGHSKDSSIFRTRVFLKWMSETMDHFDTKQDQLFEQDICDVDFDARHNKYCEISWQEISGHGREETTRILIKERKEKIYVAGSNIRRSQHSNDISLKVKSILDGGEDNDGEYMNAVSHGHNKASSIFKSKKSKASL
ncbi:unnamed protein product [Arabidopsis thaliana]|uniref:Uncharacterized protein n=1 Tax=Arabidopsis thaliana TaxID=3702 RepID=A0A5S9WKG9_ARATH|nr:unnamed protein product [Arabidopsis thaliana]